MSPREFGPSMVDDDGREFRMSEDEARSALGAAGGLLIAMTAWDFGAHAWVTFSSNPHAVPVYLPPLLRLGVRLSGVAAGAAICVAAWREQSPRGEPREDVAELNGRSFVTGRRPGARE